MERCDIVNNDLLLSEPSGRKKKTSKRSKKFINIHYSPPIKRNKKKKRKRTKKPKRRSKKKNIKRRNKRKNSSVKNKKSKGKHQLSFKTLQIKQGKIKKKGVQAVPIAGVIKFISKKNLHTAINKYLKNA